MKHRPVLWIVCFIAAAAVLLTAVAVLTVRVDPFFHYHQPDTSRYYYTLNNQRSQNNGIIRHFDYQGMITGTSMTECFRTSEAEALWGSPFIKVAASGGSYKEINGQIAVAAACQRDLKYVIRGLDFAKMPDDKDAMLKDLGSFPEYLYDNDPFNDVRYVFNRDVTFSRVLPMVKDRMEGKTAGGITSFDDYSNWMKWHRFGKDTVLPKNWKYKGAGKPVKLKSAVKKTARANIRRNVTAVAAANPEITFYYFITPYSAYWWAEQTEKGRVEYWIGIERLLIEECLKHDNIRLFSFNTRADITADLNNYRDSKHYGEWINSLMLRCMYDGRYRLTADNYEAYLAEEAGLYESFAYESLSEQEDYEDDQTAALPFADEIRGILTDESARSAADPE